MSSRPVLNFKNLFQEENKKEVKEKEKSHPSGLISMFNYKEKRIMVTDKPVESFIEQKRYDERDERSNEYLRKWIEEQERLREELIEDIGLYEYERLYKVYPDEDEEEIFENEDIEEILEEYEDFDYDDYYDN